MEKSPELDLLVEQLKIVEAASQVLKESYDRVAPLFTGSQREVLSEALKSTPNLLATVERAKQYVKNLQATHTKKP